MRTCRAASTSVELAPSCQVVPTAMKIRLSRQIGLTAVESGSILRVAFPPVPMLGKNSQDPFAPSKYIEVKNSLVAEMRCLEEFYSKIFRFLGFNDLFG